MNNIFKLLLTAQIDTYVKVNNIALRHTSVTEYVYAFTFARNSEPLRMNVTARRCRRAKIKYNFSY